MLRFRGRMGQKLVLRIQNLVYSQPDLSPVGAYWTDERDTVAIAPRHRPAPAILALMDGAQVVTTAQTDDDGLAILIVPVWLGETYSLAVTTKEGRRVYAVRIDQHDGFHEAVLMGH